MKRGSKAKEKAEVKEEKNSKTVAKKEGLGHSILKSLKLGPKYISNDELFKVDKAQDKNASPGVPLDDNQSKFLLPHFLMMLIGKPGSGKTTLMQKLINSKKFYYKKFDKIYIISPSFQKLSINVPDQNKTAQFDLDWIFEKIDDVNQQQRAKLMAVRAGTLLGRPPLTLIGPIKNEIKGEKQLSKERKIHNNTEPPAKFSSLLQDLHLQVLGTNIAKMGREGVLTDQLNRSAAQSIVDQLPDKEKPEVDPVNVLFVFDDVVGQIKKNEFEPRVQRLFFNRRHLIEGGTISIMLVSQKYTRIPSQIRSNASWLILFKINPKDFENVYEDAIMLSKNKWQEVLQFAFEMDEDGVQVKGGEGGDQDKTNVKSFNTLGVWVEKDQYFKNFQAIIL